MIGRTKYVQFTDLVDSNGKPVKILHDYRAPVPLTYEQREANYRRQNDYRSLTSRQERQLARKALALARPTRPESH